ncbi:MAG: GNAT family N-acetyltransferase [Proteobacteria bacterium]|nr:GNAT family N-acetyltransferase [Pseudomonadota bacterium]
MDHLYCHPDHTRQGLADLLLETTEKQARAWGYSCHYTKTSELACPAFKSAGHIATHSRDFPIAHAGQDVPIHNDAMEKALYQAPLNSRSDKFDLADEIELVA